MKKNTHLISIALFIFFLAPIQATGFLNENNIDDNKMVINQDKSTQDLDTILAEELLPSLRKKNQDELTSSYKSCLQKLQTTTEKRYFLAWVQKKKKEFPSNFKSDAPKWVYNFLDSLTDGFVTCIYGEYEFSYEWWHTLDKWGWIDLSKEKKATYNDFTKNVYYIENKLWKEINGRDIFTFVNYCYVYFMLFLSLYTGYKIGLLLEKYYEIQNRQQKKIEKSL